MRLTPAEMDRLTIFTAAEIARRRHAKGLKLNYPEAVALICDELLEDAREGKTYQEVMDHADRILARDDVLDGVAELAASIRLEATFNDGNKLIFIENPIR